MHGNTAATDTAKNAARCLLAFGAPAHVRVYPGASKPLLGLAKHDPEIHGVDGLGGVQGLPAADSPEVQALFAINDDGSTIRAIEGMARSIRDTWKNGNGNQVTIISTGPTTNIGAITVVRKLQIIDHIAALFISVYPDLLIAVEEFVFMGGAVGLGNRSPVAGSCDFHSKY